MATRINTKFVITLASIVVLLVLSMVLAFTFLKKSAEDHAHLAEEAMQRADVALANNEIKLHNSERQRAAKHYGSAWNKDASSIEYMYGFMDAHNKIICSSLTAAGNEIGSIIAAAVNIHNTINATDEDREVLYELMHGYIRMRLFSIDQNPLGAMFTYTTNRLDVVPDDLVAQRYHAISLSYMAGNRTNDTEALEDIQKLNDAAQANPEDGWLQAALARYHLGNGRRIFQAEGNQITEQVNTSLDLALTHAQQALTLAGDNMPMFVEAAGIIVDMRTNDEALVAKINEKRQSVTAELSAKLQDKQNRDALFVEEFATTLAILRRSRPAPGVQDAFDGPAQALALAGLLVEDRPDSPAAYHVLVTHQRDNNQFVEAAATASKGIETERLTDSVEFIRDNEARLKMQSLLADLKCTLALQEVDTDKRATLLTQANGIIDEIVKADTLEAQWREARVDFLRGRVMLAQGKPRQAIVLLERANQAYGSRDAQTLRLLAQTQTQLGNDKLVPSFYETIIDNNLSPGAEDLLNLINVYLARGENQQLDKAQSRIEWYRTQLPNDIRGISLEARLLAEQGKRPEAIALLQEHVEKYPQLQQMIVAYAAEEGNTEGLLNLIRQRIADRPEGTAINLPLVIQLVNIIPENEAKQGEIDRLVTDGLDPKVAEVFKRVLVSGQSTLEDQLELIDLQGFSPAETAMRKFMVYQTRNMREEARPYLEKAAELEPSRPDVLEWQFRVALMDQDWASAEQAISSILKLTPNERPALAVSECRFMRAQLLGMQAVSETADEERGKLIRQAIVSYNNALGRYSHYVDGWVQLGRLHLISGNSFAAQDSLQEALSRQSRNVEALELMGQAKQAGGDQINALEHYEQILRIQPNHPTALDRFAALAQQVGLSGRAIELRRRIAESNPNNFDNRRALALMYAQNDEPGQAKETIQALIEVQGKTRVNITALCQILGLEDNHNQAIAVVTDYINGLGDETVWQDYLLQAEVYNQAGKPDQTDASFVKASDLEKAEGTYTSSLLHAEVLFGRGQNAEAAAIFDRLIRDFPENDALKTQAAGVYLRLGDFDKAESLAQELPASIQKANLLLRVASAQPNKLGIAIQRARDAVESYPSDFGLQLSLMELLRTQQDRLPQGERDYKELLTKAKRFNDEFPDRVETKVLLGDVLLRLQRWDQAVAILEKALEFAPKHLPTNERLFSIKLTEARELAAANNRNASQEKAREALAIISILLESRPDLPQLLRSAGQAAELAGMTPLAVENYRKSFKTSQSESDLAAYVNALLNAGQGANARAVIENPENATLVSNSLALRAMRGRALAAAGQVHSGETLFTNLLTQTKDPSEQLLITRELLLTFRSQPPLVIKIIEGSLGKELPVDIEVALASMLMTQKQYAKASERLNKFLTNPVYNTATQFVILTQLALAQQESGQLVEAKATYEMVFEKLKQNKQLIPERQQVQMLNNMAYLLADQLKGYESQAIQYAQQALKLISDRAGDEEYALIQDTLGWAYFKAGQLEDAIRELEASVERYPMPANRLHLGRAYLESYKASEDENIKNRAALVLDKAVKQAKSEGDEKMIAETEKWYREAL
ncbi:MAG: tetratricopeptide repeat protein [Planctomycetota bacterium]